MVSSHANILHELVSTLEHTGIITETKVFSIENTSTDDVLLRAEDNRTFRLGSVVETVQLGLLKGQCPTFYLPLTPQLCRAIDKASNSSLEKVFVTFPSAFWEESPDQKKGAEDSSSASFTSFAHCLHPNYSKENQEHWDIELIALSLPAFGCDA
ncbi:hypothetical protein BDV29DRAFT_163048 [Aspergillus leporis]|jgi:hypothetical protein|uniref:Amine oxidase domain-containing protein n=1 Tax=Aspergillus leporis TaxID=41062 RepID=A0A5N5WKB4_9EURO|nr:hypothetical protein BDV29DRAFT_163048 [Aspergillus leporis]